MWVLISDTPGFNIDEVISSLWVTREGLAHLVSRDHSIGLHSHSHPTRMDLLSLEAQAKEYETNKNWIEAELGVVPRFVAHPVVPHVKMLAKGDPVPHLFLLA